MTRTLMALLVVALPAYGAAQPPTPPESPTAGPQGAPLPVDPDGLGISLERIERRLQGGALEPGVSPFGANLKLDFFIPVVGSAPPIDFFEGFDLRAGPVPGTAPTHRDVLEHLTPQAFRSPAPDLLSLAYWLGEQVARRLQQRQWERVYERYRQRVEAGEDVPAPRPPGQR